jgi:hypothetical protein
LSNNENKNQLGNVIHISSPSELGCILRMLMKQKGAAIQDRFVVLRMPRMVEPFVSSKRSCSVPPVKTSRANVPCVFVGSLPARIVNNFMSVFFPAGRVKVQDVALGDDEDAAQPSTNGLPHGRLLAGWHQTPSPARTLHSAGGCQIISFSITCWQRLFRCCRAVSNFRSPSA